MKRSLQELIASTSELRSLPTTTLRLMDLLDDATVDATQVLEIIEKDPSLTANLLKLANSAYYGLRRKVGTAREALILLGNETIVSLAFATSMGDILRGPLAAYRLGRNEMWHHALGTAVAAAHLASLLGNREVQDRAFTAGLVHDIGKLILNRPLRDQLDQLPPDGDFTTLLTAESSILGFNHAEAGAALGESWNFPGYLVQVTQYHHDFEAAEEDRDLVRVVAAANLASCKLGIGAGTGDVPDEVFWTAMTAMEFDEAVINELLNLLPGHLENMLSLIGESL